MPTKKLRSKSKFTLKRKVGGATDGGGAAANNNFGFNNLEAEGFGVTQLPWSCPICETMNPPTELQCIKKKCGFIRDDVNKAKRKTFKATAAKQKVEKVHSIKKEELTAFKDFLVEKFLKDGVPTSAVGVEPNILKIKKNIGGKRLEAVYQKMYPIISKKGAPPSAMKRRPNKQILETYLLFSKFKYLEIIRIKLAEKKKKGQNPSFKPKEIGEAITYAMSYLFMSREEFIESLALLEEVEVTAQIQMMDDFLAGVRNAQLEARLARLRDPTARGMKNQIIIFKNPKPKRRKPKPKPKRQIKRKIKI
jgi:hypothetical protein